jgi:hypothetical protein
LRKQNVRNEPAWDDAIRHAGTYQKVPSVRGCVTNLPCKLVDPFRLQHGVAVIVGAGSLAHIDDDILVAPAQKPSANLISCAADRSFVIQAGSLSGGEKIEDGHKPAIGNRVQDPVKS